MTGAMVQFEGVDFAYDGTPVLSGIDLEIPEGRITAVMGPSGCGKTTLLALAAGLLRPDKGRVESHSTRLGVVFQDPALLPWRTALGNVSFALVALGLSRRERLRRARRMLRSVGLSPEDWDKYPRQLSGGMRQRVALARALAVEPDLLLCDEPFRALDTPVRKELWQILRGIRQHAGLTTVIVTHDVDEAMRLADVLVILSAKGITQIGPPADIRARPANAFVRAFIGG
ncbi:Sulfate and thiosulfate import ATP-binding protein CysA [Rhodovulum sp. P5]|uniref:ABC transporter ATP-binding protein n=1 Tax=Rhodovulum sp. P5 TaxID=1564506 RepID=UPI0009C2C945|nr:ABC transporter ATP-binding protein [Rhodovulum sp. P5]ARE41984.1 Sulfate and thiosulfate import ATP-binding protein CysA [Rhodovulum sp. P5]